MTTDNNGTPPPGGPQGASAPSGTLDAVVVHKDGSREPQDLQDDGMHPFRLFLKSIFGW